MLRIRPIASSFHSADQVRAVTAAVSARLQAAGLAHTLVDRDANVLFIATGGTEHAALAALEGRPTPALLLAHPNQNSLPASLEILSHLHQAGRKGRIILLNEGEAGVETLRGLGQHLSVYERMRSRRIGCIGMPSDWLVGSMPEPAHARQSWGPEIVDVPIDTLRSAIDDADAAEAEALMADFRQGAIRIQEPSDRDLLEAARVAVGLRNILRSNRLDACTVRCFDLVLERKTTGCLALSHLLDEGMVAGCEGDIPAALTMLWMKEMSGQLTFMANPQDLDPASDTLWLAHCTIARGMLKEYALRSHFESGLGVGIQGELPPGDCTVARIGGRDLRQLFVSNGTLLRNGRSDLRCRTQIEVRLAEPVRQLLRTPMGNHHVLMTGHWATALREYHELFVP